MIHIICYLSFIQLAYALGDMMIYVLYSDQTNANLYSEMRNNLYRIINQNENFFDIEFLDIKFNPNLADILIVDQIFITLDATFDAYYNRIIYQYSEENKIVNLVLSLSNSFNGKWQFFLHNSVAQHQKVAEMGIGLFGWKNMAIISNEKTENIKISSYIEKQLKNQVSLKLILPQSINGDSTTNLISKIIKPDGVQMFYILEEGESFSSLIEILKNKKIYKKGAGVMAGSWSIWAPSEDGIILFVEKGLETAQSYSEYEMLAIKQFTDIILEYKSKYWNTQKFDSLLLKQLFETKIPEHIKSPLFYIVNIENKEKTIKALIDGENVQVYNSTFWYPGNTTTTPRVSETEIILSIASGSKEPNDLPNNVYNSQNFEGSLYAQWVVNNSTSILKNFYITQFQTDCGSETFNADFYYNCMKPYKDQLGVAFLSPSFESGALGYILTLRSLGLEIPHCGAVTSNIELSNKTAYPEFMRISSSPDDFAKVSIKSFTYFGWNNIAVIYDNRSINLYNLFFDRCTKLGISILNDDDKRMISKGYLRSNFKDFEYLFQSVYDSKARICVMLLEVSSALHVVEGLYDVGFRNGDIVLIFKSKIGGAQAAFDDLPEFVRKRKELMHGSLSFSSIEYFGEYGKQIETEITTAFYPEDPSYKCFSFDAFMLAAHGLDYTINQGEEIEDSWILNKNLRKQRFLGCSGIISISSNSNDRNSSPKQLMNFYYNETDKIYYEELAIIFNLESSTPLTVLQKIIWPRKSDEVPKDLRDENFDCPFEKRLKTLSGKGIGLLFGISYSIFFISGVITFIIWHRWKLIDFPQLKKPKKIKFADIIIYMVIAIEFFQYLYLGPPISINPIVAYIIEVTSVDLSSIISFKGTMFWIAMIFALSMASLIIFLNIFTVTRLMNYFEVNFCINIQAFANGLMPLLGNALLIPIFSFLLNIFACTHSTGENIQDTYLDYDCYQYCWKGKHLIFAILSIIAILIYVPLTVYYRPLYQEVQESLNIKTIPKYLAIKSLAQIFFVVLKKTLGLYQSEVHGFIYLALFSVYIWVILQTKPYNYNKISLLHLFSMLEIAWSVLWTSLANVIEVTSIPWLCCQVTGWVVIFIWGTLKYNKIPSLIITKEKTDISIWFKFMLGKVEASQISPKKIKFVSKKKIDDPWKNIILDEEKIEIKIDNDTVKDKSSNSVNMEIRIYENEELNNDDAIRMVSA